MAPTIAFFGSTGDCVAACLAHCLREGYTCITLVRDSEKLTKLLSAHNASASLIASHLTIIVGSVRDPGDIRKTLFPNSGPCVDMVVSGIGSRPTWKLGNFFPTMVDPTICTEATDVIVSVLRDGLGNAPKNRPFVVAISTTGMSKHGRDIPIPYIPLYSWLLRVAHKDKKGMEDHIIGAKDEGLIDDYCVVRPTLLTNGEPLGTKKIRSAVELDNGLGEGGIGYTISKKDVGLWIFEENVKKYAARQAGQKVNPVRGMARITY